MRWAIVLAIVGLALPVDAAQAGLSRLVSMASRSVVVVEAPAGQGSAFAIGGPGQFLTNAHVVGNADQVALITRGGRRVTTEVTAVNVNRDVAQLQSSLRLPQLERTHAAANPGDTVVAIGAPGGLDGTVTRGIISAQRRIDGEPMLQTDVAVNPGNSGGPLLSRDGRVVGLVTATLSNEQGISFAIPIDEAEAALRSANAPTVAGDPDGSGTWVLVVGVVFAVLLGLGSFVVLRSRATAASGPLGRGQVARVGERDPLVVVRRRSPVVRRRRNQRR